MAGGNGYVSAPAPLHAGMGLVSGFSAVHGSAGSGSVGRTMRHGKEPALAGGFSAATMWSPPTPSNSLKGTEAEAEGGKKKRKYAAFDASGMSTSCSLCGKQFKSRQACYGHMHVHNSQPRQRDDLPKQQVHKEQYEELARTFPNLGQGTLNKMEGREMKGDGSTAAEGSTSSSLAEAQRKKIHMRFDLNKDAPEDDENDDVIVVATARVPKRRT